MDWNATRHRNYISSSRWPSGMSGKTNLTFPNLSAANPAPWDKLRILRYSIIVAKTFRNWENNLFGNINLSLWHIFGGLKNYSFSFQTACCWNCVACREDSIVAQEDTCLKCAHGEWFLSQAHSKQTGGSIMSSKVFSRTPRCLPYLTMFTVHACHIGQEWGLKS